MRCKLHSVVSLVLTALLLLSPGLAYAGVPAQDQTPPAPTDGDGADNGGTVYLPAVTGADANVTSASVPQQGPDRPPLRLKALTFVPARGEVPSLPGDLFVPDYAAGVQGYYIVQFQGPVQQVWKDQVAALGAELLSYLPEFAFKVRMTPAQAAQVAQLESVIWVGIFQPAYKIDPDLTRDGRHLYEVRVAEGIVTAPVANALAQLGIEVLGQGSETIVVAADSAQIAAIAQVLDVAWITDFVLNETHNEYGGGAIMGANATGYNGDTQIATVADTGLGDGTLGGAHADIPADRITAIYNWPGAAGGCFTRIIDDGAQDVDSGHGTHVAGSVLSDGDDPNAGLGKGTAPAANLVFQAIENWAEVSLLCQILGGLPSAGYFLTGLPDDLGDIFQQAYDAGARVHSNSWGAAVAGDYTADSANTDDFIWNNPDMTITFSAGNSGTDANGDGVVDNDSIGSPGTAKNVITVGASENDRQGNWDCDTGLDYTDCAAQGGQNEIFTYGEAWPDDYPAEPLASDPSAGNAEQMAAFSSRGPTDDSRIKPDVVAPGTWILSGYSDLYQEGYDSATNPQNGAYQYDGWGYPFSSLYKYMGGTSMSNPLTAGAATVVRDYYQKAHSHNASAALVKATLINSAVDLLDENNDGADDNDFPIPNVHEGWGRVNLANATDGSYEFVDETSGLNTGGSASYQFDHAGDDPFKVSLVWSDYPSTEAAAQNLVNDLNLVVTAPDGATYLGNVFSGGWSTTGGSVDDVNNVENVYVQSAAAGTWTVEVTAVNVPNGPQPFALVVDGSFGPVDNPPSVTITNPEEGSTVSGTVTVTADASDDDGVTQVEFFVGDSSIGVDVDGTDGWSASWDTTAVADGSHTVSAVATDTAGQTATDENSVTVDNEDSPPSVTVTNPADGSTVSGTIEVTADASDDDGVTQVEFFVGDSSIGVDTDGADGWSTSWDTTTAADGDHTISAVATDTAGQTATDENSVTVDNTAPNVTITSPTDGETVSGTIEVTADASDATSDVTQVEFFADGDSIGVDTDDTDGWSTSWDTTTVANGDHTLTATATDAAGNAATSDAVTVTVDNDTAPTTMHVGDLDGSSSSNGFYWSASVTIAVHDSSENPVANATVSGGWSTGFGGSTSCTTGSNGQCTVERGVISNNRSSVTFTVNSVSHDSLTYDSAANHDPDGDSNGTQITINRP